MSEVVGVVLLFGIVIIGVGLVLVSGYSVQQGVQDDSDFRSAELSMQEFRGEMSSMAYENDSTVEFEFAAENTERVGVEEDGYMEFALNGRSDCRANRSMGMVRYEQDDGDVVAYEANGVWKKTDENGSVMLEAPNLRYRNETIEGGTYHTLNYPLVNVNATESDAGRSPTMTARDTDGEMRAEIEEAMCLRDSSPTTVDEVDNVTIRVKFSTFYQAWAGYFNDTFGDVPNASIHVFDANDSVHVRDIPLGLIPGTCADEDPSTSFTAVDAAGNEYDDSITVEENETVYFTGNAVDPDASGCDEPGGTDDGITSESITATGLSADVGGPGPVTFDSDQGTFGWASETTGSPYVVTYTATDDNGNTVTETIEVTVVPDTGGGGGGGGSVPPACTSTDPPDADLRVDGDPDRVTVTAGTQVRFTGDTSDGDGCGPGPSIRSVELRGPGISETGSSANDTPKTWGTPGVYRVTYTVVDNEGEVGQDEVIVEVTGSGPGGGPPGGGGVPDRDNDGVPDGVDECETTYGEGENGCAALSEEPDGLRVNQSSGNLTILGSQVTRRTVDRDEGRAADVMFVLDDTGSMAYDSDELRNSTQPDPGTYTVPDDRAVWLCRDWDGSSCNGQATYGEGETYQVFAGDNTIVGVYLPGNDPDDERVEATEGALDILAGSDRNRAGVVQFTAGASVRAGLTNDTDYVRSRIDVDSNGNTNISAGLEAAIERLEGSDGPEEDIVVLLTDGNNTADVDGDGNGDGDLLNRMTEDLAERAARENITIYTIGLGSDVNRTLLEDGVANVTPGGEYYAVGSASGLDSTFQEIVEDAYSEERSLEYDEVTSVIGVSDTANATTIDLGDVNGPADGGGSSDVSPDDPGWLLSLTSTVVQCEDRTETGRSVDYRGDTYEEVECEGTTPVEEVDSSDPEQDIYTDGETLRPFEGDESKPWQQSVRDIVPSYMIEGNEFNLTPNQAIIVTRFGQGNLTVALFEADDTPPPSGTCDDEYPDGDLSVPGVVSQGSSATLVGDAWDRDTCGLAPNITSRRIVVDRPGGGTQTFAGNETPYTFSTTGDYDVTFEFTDNEGTSFSVSETVRVTSSGTPGGPCRNGAPDAAVDASSTDVEVGEEVVIQGRANDTDACGTGDPIQSESLTGPSVSATNDATVSYSTPGERQINYTVTDNEGTTVEVSVTIDVDASTASPGPGSGGPDDGFVIGIGGDEVTIGDEEDD